VSFGLSYFVAVYLDVATFSAAVQTASAVALMFDYSLFLFTKVKSEMQLGSNPRQAINQMLHYSIHVVMVSGTCLALVFLLLTISGVELITSIGVCSFVTIMVVQLVSTTNTAAMMAIFPKFFLGEDFDFWSYDYLNPKRI
jgi:RND superfamily putative drug exporter